jgi:lactoylglutathione lyase
MTLNHLNLAVSDVQLARAFLVEYFGLTPEGKGNDRIAALRSDNGLVLTLSNFDRVSEVQYPGGFHIGFGLGTREEVDEINRRLRDDGFAVDPPAKDHGA